MVSTARAKATDAEKGFWEDNGAPNIVPPFLGTPYGVESLRMPGDHVAAACGIVAACALHV